MCFYIYFLGTNLITNKLICFLFVIHNELHFNKFRYSIVVDIKYQIQQKL